MKGKTKGIILAFSVMLAALLIPGGRMVVQATETDSVTRLEALQAVADNALKYGRNHEGAKYPMMITDGMDIVTKEPTIWNRFSENQYYICNLYGMNNLLKMMEGLSTITGDETYKEAAYTQIQTFCNEEDFTDDNGLFYTGAHSVMDIMHGRHTQMHHETKDNQIPVELFYRADPEGFKRYVNAFWNANVYDWSNLTMNRHGEYDKAMSSDAWSLSIDYDPNPWIVSNKIPFTATGNDMIELAYYMTHVTGDAKYQQWGERMLDKYIGITDENTGLTGSQYGVNLDEDTDALDRFLYNFAGADFVDINGINYKTLTEADYEKVGETQRLNRFTVQSAQGFLPQVYSGLYEMTGEQKLYDMAKNNILGFVRYVYDSERHRFITPMSTNGTDFNPGEGNGPILVAPCGGYYATEGSIFAESETIQLNVLKAMIDVVHMLKDEDATERQEIWDTVRIWGKKQGLGDLGSAMGENVNVNLNTTNVKSWDTLAVVTLYKYTGHQQYYDLAIKMADNILNKYYDPEIGMFITNSKAPYTSFDTEEMYAVYCVEAMTNGMVDDILLEMAKGSIDLPHEGMGQVTDGDVFYSREKVAVEKVDLGSEQYALVLDTVPNIEINDVSDHEDEKAIRQMVSLGLMEVDEAGNFHPEAEVTRGDFVQMVTKLFGFEDTTVPADFRFTDVTGTSYYEAVLKAENAGILDENLGATLFEGDKSITREEMASIMVKALQLTRTDVPWYVANALYRIEDADSISAWAKDYVDIATNYRLMVEFDETVFEAKLDVTKAMAADALQNACRYLTLEGVQSLNAVVTPYDADSQVVSWKTSDATVLEVDAQGRLYPLKAGSAIITARADQQYAQVEVTVSEKEDWMIKEVLLNGEPLNNFNAGVLEYDVNLYLGTTQIESLTATSFTGASVEVTLPNALPGTVELKVEGTDVVYTINVDNTLVEYTINEDFNHEIDTSLLNVKTDKYSWYVVGNSTRYNEYMKIVSKTQVQPDYEEDGCMIFPYHHEQRDGAVYRACLADDYVYTLGTEADEMQLVIEVDFAVKNMTGKMNGYILSFQTARANGTTSAIATFNINGDYEISRITSSTQHNSGTTQTLEDGKFYTITLVVDKQNKTFNYYFDEKLWEKDVNVLHKGIQDFGLVYFAVNKEEEYSDAELYCDGIRIYELQKSVVEERFEQAPQPTYTPKPTAAPTPRPTEMPIQDRQPELPPDYFHLPDEKGYCTDCGEIANGRVAVAGRSLILNDDIGVTFYLEFTDKVDKDAVKVEFTLANGKTSEVTFADSIVKNNTPEEGRTAYGFTCSLYAHEMNQFVTAKVYEGNDLISQYSYSIEQYSQSQLAPEAGNTQETVDIINAMLTYGEKSQIYFGQEIDNLVTKNLTVPEMKALSAEEKEVLQSYPKTIVEEVGAKNVIGVKGMTLVLYAETALRAGFTFGTNPETSTPYTLGDFTYEAYKVEKDGEGNISVMETISDGYTGTYQGISYFDIPNISPAELDELYNIVVKKDGVKMLDIVYSPFAYIKSKVNADDANLVNVVTALYRYHEAAEAYTAKE